MRTVVLPSNLKILVLHGSDDQIISVDSAQASAELINADFEAFDGIGEDCQLRRNVGTDDTIDLDREHEGNGAGD